MNDACDDCQKWPCEHEGFEANCEKWVMFNAEKINKEKENNKVV